MKKLLSGCSPCCSPSCCPVEGERRGSDEQEGRWSLIMFSQISSELIHVQHKWAQSWYLLESEFTADASQKIADLNLSAWITGIDENNVENKKTKTKQVFQTSKKQERGSFGWRNSVRLNSLSFSCLLHIWFCQTFVLTPHLSRASEFCLVVSHLNQIWQRQTSSWLLWSFSPSLQGVGGQSSPAVLHPCHPRLLDVGVNLALSSQHSQCLNLYLPSLRFIWPVFFCADIFSLYIANKSFFVHPGLLDSQPQVQRKLNP